jgi:uncharacterized protein (UPF0212 family)
MTTEHKQVLCSYCKKEVDSQAQKCPHCQSDLRSWVRRHWILSGIMGFVILIIIIVNSSNSSERAKTVAEEVHTGTTKVVNLDSSKEYNARHYANNLIKALPLKSPSTAEYKPAGTPTKTATNTYEVSSYVDSQNGFGAMVRAYWTVTLKYIGEEQADQIDYTQHPKNWKIIKVIFDGQKVI